MENGKRSVILDGEELDLCQKIAADNKNLFYKRAIVLLALNDGKSRREAADISGLSPGQVKYIAAKFLKIRTDILYAAGSDIEKVETETSIENIPETGPTEAIETAETDEAESDEIEVEILSSEKAEAKAKKQKKDKKKNDKKKSDKKKKAKSEKKEKKDKKEKKKEKSKNLKKDKEKKKKSGKVKKTEK
jgi:hypothetical protein